MIESLDDIMSDETLSLAERDELSRYEQVIEHGLQTFVEVGEALLVIRDKRLYRDDYSTFEGYCRQRWNMTRMRASQLIAASEVMHNVNNCLQILPANEAQARPLTQLPPEQQRDAWQYAVETAPEGGVTAGHVQNIVDWMRVVQDGRTIAPAPAPLVPPHVSYNSGNNEWYTPAAYVDAARFVMGSIELDPASSELANITVQAGTFYTQEDDGLMQDWHGRVWMNPPYAGELIGLFCAKLIRHILGGDVQEAIVLVNNATETAWFQGMLPECSAICFPKSRVRFVTSAGEMGAPLQGQAVLYFGHDVERFVEVFSAFGSTSKWQ